MGNLRKAAEQALTALEAMQSYAAAERKGLRICDEAVITITAALAEPEPEPVAWMVYTLDSKSVCVTDNPADFTGHHRALPLYTSPPAAALAEPEPEEIARLEDRIDWLENGLAEWRDMALSNARQAKAARATARIAIGHLKAVLAECAYDPVRADMEAQDWLVSIGDDVEEKK